MIRLTLSRSAFAVLAALTLAAPARAQTGSGPVRMAAPDAARLSAPATLRLAAAAVPTAARVDTLALSRPRLYYSAPLASLMGVAGVVLGYGSGLGLLNCQDEAAECLIGPDDSEYLLAYAGLTIGAATGAHVGGKTRDSKGSVFATLGGAALGALPVLFAPRDDDAVGSYAGGIVGGTAGAVLVDYLVRRPRN
ncbi:MAG TPA: hypothetical protein VGB92_07070 [Longimicrobium sp.]|jgi:hypothetical protein